MGKTNADQEIRERVDAFVSDLNELIRQAALEAVQEALGGTGAGAAAPAPRRGRPPGRKTSARKKAGTKRASGKRVRRTEDQIAAIGEEILAAVKANPGSGFESLRSALDIEGKDLRRPLNDLLDAGSLRKEGEKRGTKYFVGAGKPARRTSKKASKKRAKKKVSRKQASRKKSSKKTSAKR